MCIVGGHNDAIKQNAAILPELQFLFGQINYELCKPLRKAQFSRIAPGTWPTMRPRNLTVKLSITHNFRSDHGAQRDVGQAG